MATRTPIRHPQESAQMSNFYPHSVTFKMTVDDGVQEAVLTSPCSYEPRGGGAGEDFEGEAPTADQLLLPKYHSLVAPDFLAVVTFADETVKRFTVLDSLAEGVGPNQTLVLLTTKR